MWRSQQLQLSLWEEIMFSQQQNIGVWVLRNSFPTLAKNISSSPAPSHTQLVANFTIIAHTYPNIWKGLKMNQFPLNVKLYPIKTWSWADWENTAQTGPKWLPSCPSKCVFSNCMAGEGENEPWLENAIRKSSKGRGGAKVGTQCEWLVGTSPGGEALSEPGLWQFRWCPCLQPN